MTAVFGSILRPEDMCIDSLPSFFHAKSAETSAELSFLEKWIVGSPSHVSSILGKAQVIFAGIHHPQAMEKMEKRQTQKFALPSTAGLQGRFRLRKLPRGLHIRAIVAAIALMFSSSARGEHQGSALAMPQALPRHYSAHRQQGYLHNVHTLPTKHLDVLRRSMEDVNVCERDAVHVAAKAAVMQEGSNQLGNRGKETCPPLALCLDFDKTLSQQHLHHLTRASRNGLAGVDVPAAFGGGERIQSLMRFLDAAKSLGAAVHIISHNHKTEILQALNNVGLGSHFPEDTVYGWNELQEAHVASKTECVMQIAKGYGLSQHKCLLVDDDQENLEDAQGIMTYWVSSGRGLSEADMGCILNVVHTMRVAPDRLHVTATDDKRFRRLPLRESFSASAHTKRQVYSSVF